MYGFIILKHKEIFVILSSFPNFINEEMAAQRYVTYLRMQLMDKPDQNQECAF